jgi:hypothetical protein
MIETIDPSGTSTETWFTATRPPNSLVTFSALRIAGPREGWVGAGA